MKNLEGTKVLVTRPEDQSENLCRLISLAGGEAIKFPTLKISPSAQLTQEQMREFISWADGVIFISRNAVIYLDRLLNNIAAELSGKSLYATGRGTVMALEGIGIDSVMSPAGQYGSEGLLGLEELSPSRIMGKNLVIIRGEEGRDLLRDVLQERGAEVKYACIYRSGLPDLAPALTESIWQNLKPDIIVLTSNQGLQNLIQMTAQKDKISLFNCKLVVMSNRIADTAQKAGFVNPPKVAARQSDDGLLEAIQQSVEQ